MRLFSYSPLRILKLSYRRLYYYTINSLLEKKTIALPERYRQTKNIFLYFDYEREFGGNATNISDSDIDQLLDELDRNNIRATWFTVGLIFKYYPDSVRNILSRGHEIGSHSFSHLAPLNASVSKMERDLLCFKEVASPYTHVKGFHSPNGRWNLALINQLLSAGYQYDMISCKGEGVRGVEMVRFGRNQGLMRFCSAGDDWTLLRAGLSDDSVFDHFLALLNKARPGTVTGIGFHPWILFSDKKIFSGFLKFLSYLSSCEQTNIRIAGFYNEELLKVEDRN